jgi:hypothetical protein
MSVMHSLFAGRPVTAKEQFRLLFFAAVLDVTQRAATALGSFDEAEKRFPFLAAYLAQVPPELVEGECPANLWYDEIREWAGNSRGSLPLSRLAEAGVGDFALRLFFWSGLAEEDARFGQLFSAFQDGAPRPTISLLQAWLNDGERDVRLAVEQLSDYGLTEVLDRGLPRAQWTLAAAAALWDIVRGTPPSRLADGASLQDYAALPPLESLILDEAAWERAREGAEFIENVPGAALLIRGPVRNGRTLLAQAIAREARLGAVTWRNAKPPDAKQAALLAAAAAAADAALIIRCGEPIGEELHLPAWFEKPLLLVATSAGLALAGRRPVLTLELPLPGRPLRMRHWSAATADPEQAAALADRFRLPSGRIHSLARTARPPSAAKCGEALRAEAKQAFEGLAGEVRPGGDWESFAGPPALLEQLRGLELRCRLREQLPEAAGPVLSRQMSCGVIALFRGPSGTGKTFAARVLASALGKDLFRADLASVVSKYIGETEKNLDRLLTQAEQFDVLLLLDEGDSLLAQRTMIATSNDRYANLETNFLLQRLENFEGILLITSNAGDRIDRAFERRLDVVIDFPAPGAVERLAIWRLHLPQQHRLDEPVLREVAGRCSLSGGQIRNAVAHACLLALSESGLVTRRHLQRALDQEYRKTGGQCPVRLS